MPSFFNRSFSASAARMSPTKYAEHFPPLWVIATPYCASHGTIRTLRIGNPVKSFGKSTARSRNLPLHFRSQRQTVTLAGAKRSRCGSAPS
jgi:hypothetical protein